MRNGEKKKKSMYDKYSIFVITRNGDESAMMGCARCRVQRFEGSEGKEGKAGSQRGPSRSTAAVTSNYVRKQTEDQSSKKAGECQTSVQQDKYVEPVFKKWQCERRGGGLPELERK